MNLYITLFLVVRACFYYRGGFGFVLLRGFSSLEVSLIFAFYIWGPDDLVRHLCPEMFFPVLYIYGIQSISFKIDFASLCGAMAWAGCLVHPANHANLMPQHNLVSGSMAAQINSPTLRILKVVEKIRLGNLKKIEQAKTNMKQIGCHFWGTFWHLSDTIKSINIPILQGPKNMVFHFFQCRKRMKKTKNNKIG